MPLKRIDRRIKMIIYEFSTWGTNGQMYSVKEIEVEEKPKTYIARGIRVNKDDIGKLQNNYGNRMYRLDNDPKPYIAAVLNYKKYIMEQATEKLKRATADFDKWFDLKELVGEDNNSPNNKNN